ncbi:MAG: 26.3 kDa putative nuclear pore complex-like protein [Novo Mesto picornavirus 1]|nr:MAG: 26.3 kDa putative nuclear pore complex-like protein [Novo Mesto picornavirus 1]
MKHPRKLGPDLTEKHPHRLASPLLLTCQTSCYRKQTKLMFLCLRMSVSWLIWPLCRVYERRIWARLFHRDSMRQKMNICMDAYQVFSHIKMNWIEHKQRRYSNHPLIKQINYNSHSKPLIRDRLSAAMSINPIFNTNEFRVTNRCNRQAFQTSRLCNRMNLDNNDRCKRLPSSFSKAWQPRIMAIKQLYKTNQFGAALPTLLLGEFLAPLLRASMSLGNT